MACHRVEERAYREAMSHKRQRCSADEDSTTGHGECSVGPTNGNVPLPEEVVGFVGPPHVYKLVEFDVNKAKQIVVKSTSVVGFSNLEQNSLLNLMIKRSARGLSRLVKCACCREWQEWSVADEERVPDPGTASSVVDASSLKSCKCKSKVGVSICKCCPFFFYRDAKDLPAYLKNQHRDDYCSGKDPEQNTSWRQLRESLPRE